MPFILFLCKFCQIKDSRLLPRVKIQKTKIDCPKCGKHMTRVLGVPNAREIQTADEYRNKKVPANIDQMVEERANQHFREHELPRIIDEKGLGYAQEHGLADQDGKAKV
jgi:hypothetical protein